MREIGDEGREGASSRGRTFGRRWLLAVSGVPTGPERVVPLAPLAGAWAGPKRRAKFCRISNQSPTY